MITHFKLGPLLKLAVSKTKSGALTFIDFSSSLSRRFIENQGFMVASSMAYSTLISIVPFILFVTIFLNSLNIIDLQFVKEAINENVLIPFLPTYQEEIMLYLDHIIENSKAFGWIGFVSFLFSSLFLINKISMTFNWIYNTKPKKNWFIQLALFLFGLIGFVLILSVVLTIIIPTLSWVKNHQLIPSSQFVSILNSKVTPWIFIFVGLFFMIWLIPASKVNFISAAIGAICGTLSWQLANTLFIKLISTTFSYEKIYGSLAAIVIFFVWINILWILIYLALEISYTHQYKIFATNSRSMDLASPCSIIDIDIAILKSISNFHESNLKKRGLPLNQICKNIGLPDLIIHKEIRRLETNNLIVRTRRWPFLYALKKPLDQIESSALIRAIYGSPIMEQTSQSNQEVASEILALLEDNYKDLKADSIIKKGQN